MDKISKLLAEAKPMYFERVRRRRIFAGAACMVLFMIGLLPNVYFKADGINDEHFEAYYASLYDNDDMFSYVIDCEDTLPLDGYGFYEVI